MNLTLYQIDAFTNKLFKGNPAAVIPLDYWIEDELMQNIAMENNLAETAFICPSFRAAKVSHLGGDLEGAVALHFSITSSIIPSSPMCRPSSGE